MSVIVVSNRVARAKTDEPVSGGLAAALIPMVRDSGAIWVGTNDQAHDAAQYCTAEPEPLGKGALAKVNVPAWHYRGFYEGFANSALWPALHSRADSRADLIRVAADDYASYREVNACMARALLRFAEPEARYWIHDYHFLPLGAELRALKVDRPIGFFLHTRGRRAASWRPCRTTASSRRRCWPMTSSASRPTRIGAISRTISSTNLASP